MSVSKELTLDQFKRYLHGLPEALEKAAVRGIRTGAARAVDIARQAGDEAPPASDHGSKGAFDTGKYRRGWRARHIEGGAEVGNYSGHADIIERGRQKRSKRPPLAVIARWAERRLGLSKRDAKLAAFPIARAIDFRGLLGRFPLKRATPEIIRVVMEEVRRAVGEALRGGHE